MLVQTDLVVKVSSLLSALQHYVSNNTKSGLTDVSSSIEVLISEVLRVTEKWDLVNANLFQSNFPSIDLVDGAKRVAVQVTSNANSAKCADTINKFSKYSLNGSYNKLHIYGFCKASKVKNLPSNVVVEGPSSLLVKIKTLKIEELVNLEKLLRGSYDFSKLAPLADRDCFHVVLSVLDRDAIRHSTSVEGSFSDFSKALKEIKEIITIGSIASKNIFAKPLSHYSGDYEKLLRDIDLNIGKMLAEVNRAKAGECYFLTNSQKSNIDRWRALIITEVNDFCVSIGNSRRIHEIR